MRYQEAELVITDCDADRAGIDYHDYVIEVDGRFLPDTTDGIWQLGFRCESCKYAVSFNGGIRLAGFGSGNINVDNAALPGYQSNHLLMIAKGGRFAFYVNDRPIYYIDGTPYRMGNISLGAFGEGSGTSATPNTAVVAFDNFKVWEISDLP
jgi:hypothetical protein